MRRMSPGKTAVVRGRATAHIDQMGSASPDRAATDVDTADYGSAPIAIIGQFRSMSILGWKFGCAKNQHCGERRIAP